MTVCGQGTDIDCVMSFFLSSPKSLFAFLLTPHVAVFVFGLVGYVVSLGIDVQLKNKNKKS